MLNTLVNNLNKVSNLANHATQRWRILTLNDPVDFAQTKRLKSALLVYRTASLAFYLLNLDCCHDCISLSFEYFSQIHAAVLSHSLSVTHIGQSLDCSLNQIVRVGRPLGLSQDVSNAHTLEHGTHGTTGNHTCTFRSWHHKNTSSTELCISLMWDSSLDDWNPNQILLGSLYTLGDGSRNFACFTKTIANNTVTITYNNDGCECKCTTTLSNLSNTINSNQAVLKLGIVLYFNFIYHNRI